MLLHRVDTLTKYHPYLSASIMSLERLSIINVPSSRASFACSNLEFNRESKADCNASFTSDWWLYCCRFPSCLNSYFGTHLNLLAMRAGFSSLSMARSRLRTPSSLAKALATGLDCVSSVEKLLSLPPTMETSTSIGPFVTIVWAVMQPHWSRFSLTINTTFYTLALPTVPPTWEYCFVVMNILSYYTAYCRTIYSPVHQ